jgi:CheY-like chemotaxis protein
VPKQIAVIDDDGAIRRLVEATLSEEGYEMLLLGSAEAAAAALRTTVPDLIFLDIHMEQRDIGWYLLSLLWLQPVLSTVPVIVCSGDRDALARLRREVPAPHCVLLDKPFDVQDLIDAVRRLIDAGDGAVRPA